MSLAEEPGRRAGAGGRADDLVTVVVPAYDVEAFLPACVESVLAQTHRNLDVVLVDDGSPDGCGAICDAFAARDARVRAVHQENAGLSCARNIGLDLARGEWVAFVDGDDAVSPRFVETLLAAEADVAQCGFATEGAAVEGKAPEGCEPPAFEHLGRREALERLQTDGSGAWTVAWDKLYRRSVLDDLRFPVGRQHEDEFFTYRAIWEAEGAAVTDSALYYYRQRAGSIMGSGFSRKSLDAFLALEERAAFYRAHGEERLAALTDATTCHRLRAATADMARALPPEEAARWKAVMHERYRAVMRSPEVGAGKKLSLTLQMASPALHRVLRRG